MATDASNPSPLVLSAPWSPAAFSEVKGVLHAPADQPTLNSETRDALLTAIAKARRWIDGVVEGRIASFAEIAKQEGKVERHIRLLCPLAFVSPRIISAIHGRLGTGRPKRNQISAAAGSFLEPSGVESSAQRLKVRSFTRLTICGQLHRAILRSYERIY
jgi:hypothetical protein